MTLPGDGTEYHLLTAAARDTAVLGLVCEVGCRLGGGVQAILDGLQSPRVIVSIDPYGNIEYHHSDRYPQLYDCGYNREMQVQALTTIPAACHAKGHLWIPLLLEDREFFRRFADGVPVYQEAKFLVNDYALVHLDGPHATGPVLIETEFFAPRIPLGGAIVYDNWTYFDSEQVFQYLARQGFAQEAIGAEKAVFRKVA